MSTIQNDEIGFTKALQELKEIVTKLEGEVTLEEGISLIEEGIRLHKLCKEKLENAQVKITKLFDTPQVA